MLNILKLKIKNYIYRRKLLKQKTVIKPGAFFFQNNISFGEYCYVGPSADWFAQGGIEIGDGTIIGPKSVIWTADHNYESIHTAPYDKQVLKKKVTIGKGCWLGYGIKICPGVTIGDGAVIAMGSVVTKNVEQFAVVGGNPAKVIKYRSKKDTVAELIKENNYYMKVKNEKL